MAVYIFHSTEYEMMFERKAFGGEIEVCDLPKFFEECDLYPSQLEMDDAVDVVIRGGFVGFIHFGYWFGVCENTLLLQEFFNITWWRIAGMVAQYGTWKYGWKVQYFSLVLHVYILQYYNNHDDYQVHLFKYHNPSKL